MYSRDLLNIIKKILLKQNKKQHQKNHHSIPLEVVDDVLSVEVDDVEVALATITAGGGGGGGGAACFFGDFGGRFGGWLPSSASEFSPLRPPDEDIEAVDSAGVDSHLWPRVNVIK